MRGGPQGQLLRGKRTRPGGRLGLGVRACGPCRGGAGVRSGHDERREREKERAERKKKNGPVTGREGEGESKGKMGRWGKRRKEGIGPARGINGLVPQVEMKNKKEK